MDNKSELVEGGLLEYFGEINDNFINCIKEELIEDPEKLIILQSNGGSIPLKYYIPIIENFYSRKFEYKYQYLDNEKLHYLTIHSASDGILSEQFPENESEVIKSLLVYINQTGF